ncbi:MAG: 50S ribosomal protein L6 [Alphaproteobacteria bacterium]|nr:50S ribosomal protein L6 [Alphaproteobacteria bacterium]
MSRIGKQPITVPAGVTVTIGDEIAVKGPKGNLTQKIVANVTVSQEGNEILVKRNDDSKPSRANHGLMRALVQNMVTGVTQGFEKKLSIIGVGYRAEVKGSKLVMNLGFSHPIEFDIPAGINIEADKTNGISVKGADKQQVGQVAAVIRGYRKPDHYKGKGVRYADEYVRIKAGKSA